ncbi:peptidylprolyl isomerase [Oculatella sp. LEGE 06141]|uniref:peptidylprolyl isomerase n=1 Tax=Oculatella sp. LEGE 06141 TaxID=1828648 RepID=UPI00187F62A3|nr:peptidylprolyl isomerase [Oculatella sp. LEGE 06141]MBE9181603.1 peptidylprolyl isomerase [Oculatella sp. LEGE 06141]
MGTHSFLVVDDEPIYLGQAVRYLQASGRLDAFIADILHRHVLERELKQRTELAVSAATLEQMLTDFRLENQLGDPEQFDLWLAEQGLDYAKFRQQLEFDLRLEQFTIQIAQPKLQEYFIERKLSLDQVVLSRITVSDRDLADELRQQILEGGSFEHFAREYSISDDRLFNGMMGLMSRDTLPDRLRAAVDLASEGDILEPMPIEQDWAIVRLEQRLPATLDDPQIQQTLRNELLEQWIGEQLQRMEIEIQIDDLND